MLNWFTHFFEQYGAFAIALGAGLEGEAAVTAGGYFAHRGLIDLKLTAFSAFLGSFIVDQALFLLARYQRDHWFVRAARKRSAFVRALQTIDRHPAVFCLVFRFLYGLRIAGPLALGVSDVPARRFIVLNAASAALWAATFSYLGYRFGAAITDRLLSFVTDHAPAIALAAGVVVLCGVTILRYRKRRGKK